jgi:tetratricopeptide (TPR) repeat protein
MAAVSNDSAPHLLEFDVSASSGDSSPMGSRTASGHADTADGRFEPLFEIHYVDPQDEDVGPLSTPPAEDYPIGALVRLQSEQLVCHALQDQWRPWMTALVTDGFRVRVLRHVTTHTTIDGVLPFSAFDLVDPTGTETVHFRVTVPRSCLVGPRISNGERYPSPLSNGDDGPMSLPHLTAMDSRVHGGAGGSLDHSLHTPSARFPSGTLRMLPGSVELTHPGMLSSTLPPGTSSPTMRTWREQGNTFYKDRSVDLAVHAYTVAVEMGDQQDALRGSREHIRALSCRSAALLQLRKFDDALNDAKRIIALQPTSVIGYVRAGHVKRAQRQYAEADAYYKRALDIKPNDVNIQHQREANSLAAVMAVDLPSTIDVIVDPSKIRVVAKRHISRGQRVLTEAPVAAVAVDDDSPPTVCAHCHLDCVSADLLLRELEGRVAADAFEQASRIVRNINHPSFQATNFKFTACGHHCGTRYCSERCRSAAWQDYHWAECAQAGQWARSITEIKRLLAASSTTHSSALAPHDVHLAVRLIAVFVKRHGTASFSCEQFRRHFRSRSTVLPMELSETQCAVVKRVYDALRCDWALALRETVSLDCFTEAVEYAMQSGIPYVVSPTVRVDDAIASHIGLLLDRPCVGSEEAAQQHIATLRQVSLSLPQVAHRFQTRCFGAFRIVGCCRRAGDATVASFHELEASMPPQFSPTASQHFIPSPLAPRPPVPSRGPSPVTSMQPSSRRSLGSNVVVQPMSASTMIGIGVQATTDLPPLAPLVLDSFTLTWPTRTASSSVSAGSRTTSSSSARSGGVNASTGMHVTMPPTGSTEYTHGVSANAT